MSPRVFQILLICSAPVLAFVGAFLMASAGHLEQARQNDPRSLLQRSRIVRLMRAGIALTFVALLALGGSVAHAQEHVPDVSARYRLIVEQAAAEVWGIEASPARLAAQLHQESAWNPNARSVVGAEGLAQFMPATGNWLAQMFPELGPYDPLDPTWSARAAAVYDHWLYARHPGDGTCSQWAFALSGYNGGERYLLAEQALADKHGKDGRRWFDNTADYRARSVAAWKQNRAYVHNILLTLEPAYIAAGWAGKAACV